MKKKQVKKVAQKAIINALDHYLKSPNSVLIEYAVADALPDFTFEIDYEAIYSEIELFLQKLEEKYENNI